MRPPPPARRGLQSSVTLLPVTATAVPRALSGNLSSSHFVKTSPACELSENFLKRTFQVSNAVTFKGGKKKERKEIKKKRKQKKAKEARTLSTSELHLWKPCVEAMTYIQTRIM